MSETAHQSYLTVEAYDRLTAELAQLEWTRTGRDRQAHRGRSPRG